MIDIKNIENQLSKTFLNNKPYNHSIIDGFFDYNFAEALADDFIDYYSDKWFVYDNPIENKKALNDWNVFPDNTYKALSYLQSNVLVEMLSKVTGVNLYVDHGLHGGGWHIHANGGNLNPHLDYSIHPKLSLERKLNIIIYLSKELIPELHGGHLGFWSHDQKNKKPDKLIVEIEPKFNRAVIFDTTQMSWHGMSRKLNTPLNVYRKSLAIYYLCDPSINALGNQRALFAARDNELNDPEIERIIKMRSSLFESKKVYRT
jgi:2OG-Fe(II) oxygenase superfamily